MFVHIKKWSQSTRNSHKTPKKWLKYGEVSYGSIRFHTAPMFSWQVALPALDVVALTLRIGMIGMIGSQ